MHHNTGSGDAPAGAYHRIGSPPPNQGGPSGITSPEPHPQSPPGFSSQTHPLQQFLMGTPLQGININLRGQPVLHTRIGPTAVAPGVVPVQTGPTSPLGYQQQLSPQAISRQLHPSTQAFLQMSGLQGQAIATSGANLPQQRPVLNVPLSPGRSFVDPATGMPIHQVNISPSSSVQPSNNPFVFQDVHKTFPDSGESHTSQESLIVQNLLMPSQQPMGTIHHLGQGSPGRASMPPLSSPSRASGSPRRSSSHSPTRGAPGHKSPTGGGYRRPHSPARTSPLPSSPSLVMRKTMMPQTEERPPANAEVAELRRQVLQERLTDIKRLKETYNDKLTELFFLQNSGNMMDFLSWKKRPNQQLFVYLASHRMDDEEEKTINDEVKVITNSGSNIPVGTPVAISTQLPPAVSALSSQLNQKAREQKAREMRRSLPGSIQAAAAAAAGNASSLGDGEASRKRSFSQAGLDSVSVTGQDKKVQLMQSSHEPNITLTPSMMTAIPSLPGANDALSKQQQQQHTSHQQAPQQQHSSKLHEPSTPSRLPGHQALARNTPPTKSPPATHSLHQLKFPSPSSAGTPTSSSSTVVTPPPPAAAVARKTPNLSGATSAGASPATPSPIRTPKHTPLSPTAQQRLATRQQSLSAVYDYTIGSQEMIVEKAKQEAQVMQRIAELRKEGLWAAKRLPKVQEPPRHKTHWDYLLEEMQWLATDFAQERRWKRASARKLVRAVARHHQEQHAKEVKAEKEESQKLKKIAGNMAKEIMTFWANIEKVVQYKQQSRLEERRKKVMDLQLDYIVGQTEKYSSWLTEGLNLATSSTTTSVQGSMPSSPRSEGDADVITGDDVDFQPVGDDSDDEETIDVEENAADDDADAHAKEIELLQKESELPLEDLLSSLPPGMLDKPGSSSEGGEKGRTEEKRDSKGAGRKGEKEKETTSLKAVTEDVKDDGESKQDDEFVLSADEDEGAQDEEDTLEEQEAAEGKVDHKAEIAELEAEGDLPIEELMRRYAGAYEDEYEYPQSEESVAEESEDDTQTEESEEEEEQGTDDDEEEELADIGMEYLIHPEKVAEEPKPSKQTGKGEPNKEITDIAAAAQSLQPTGYTLSTTQVKTKVPFLLRHKLREYQHIGLDWMVTLHEKKLNGILADEMGLGKTIQTIALLAHLACEEENWGPHLIVVPTSVMLNWEMELKKWCPGFKILTYYGNQKERKQKRQGWTKSNAFHVCITSYKLVIQDHQSFRRKKWKYLVLDEAQNIKNFKSQRWQTLLNFNSQRRLLLTGTPLQNNLMELWSLMHFLMPHVFASHREFREWFSNPLSGMIEGTQEYNEGLIRRLHKVLRPFLLRRLKSEVEKQLPQKYEHVVKCRLSKRQRFLYEDFMSRARTKETLASGHFMSVINVLMQLRKVCNHPDLFEPRPITSPFQMEGINFYTASLALRALEYDPFKHVNLSALNLCIADLERFLPAYAAHRIRKLQTPHKLIEEIDSSADTPPRLPKLKVKPGKLFAPVPAAVQAQPKEGRASPLILSSGRSSPMQQGSASPVLIRTQTQGSGGRSSPVVTQFLVRSPGGTQLLRQTPTPPGTPASVPGVTTLQLTGTSTPGTFTLVSTQSPAVPGATPLQQLPGYTGATATSTTTSTASLASVVQQRLVLQQQINAMSGSPNRAQFVTSQPITLQLQQNRGQQGARIAIPASQLQLQPQGGIVRIVQTPSGQQIVRQAPQSVISQQTILQQQQLLQQRQQQPQRPLQQQVALQSVAGGQVTVNSQQLVNSIVNQVRTQATAQPTQTNQVAAAVAAPQLARIQQPQLSAVAQVQNALQQQQQQQFLQQLQQQQQLKLQQTVQTTTAQAALVSSGLAQATASTVVVATSSSAKQTESKPAQSIPKLQTVATTSGARTTTTPSKTYSTAAARKAKREAAKKSPFYLESIERKVDDDRKATLQRIATINKMRCTAKPVYGQDLFSAVSIYSGAPPAGGSNPLGSGIGHVFSQCVHVLGYGKGRHQYTDALRQLIRSPEDLLVGLEEIIKRYAIVVPLAKAPPISLHTSHPPPSFLTDREQLVNTLSTEMKPRMKCLHDLHMASRFQFPELRLIQYDCGKLQAMDILLRKLKFGAHRALIFTQMTKMLDVLERFLNYYGYIYLRLDGATRVEQRQVLMERFNADPRIFCFILSTRSGGIGVNLTGADTVIFYDSDWNPTMDAQAQDRCHRIGQTRDVHIYRLVSEMTVEENILKKANQKRLLVDVSIEGGNFTTAFFRERTIKELFDLSTTGNMGTATELIVEDLKAKTTPVATPPQGDAAAKENLTKEQLEQALARTEDETDVQAASMAHAEQDAELAEFDEDIPYEGEEGKSKEEPSKVEIELAQLDEQLTPIEKYAMKYLECTVDSVALEELKEAEEQIEEAKKEWELSRLQAIKEEEERRAEMEEDEILFTYAREDAQNKIYISQTDEIMPIWAPPTPPQDDNDVYIDHSLGLLYDPSSMMESQLPPVYIKKEPKKIKVDHVRKLKPHLPKGDAQSHVTHTIAPPQSLFNRPSAALLRMRREAKQQKLRAMAGKQVVKPLPIVHRPSTSVEAHSADRPEWLINEDWALLQAVQALQELPLTLQAVVPGHIINWDLVSDVVNACGHTYRSPKQCRSRYEGVIIPREEGKILYDTNPKKQKKSKGIYRTKSNRPMKTSQLHVQDGNSAHTQLYNSKFDLIKAAVSKKQPYLKQVLNNPLLKNPKHSAVLNDFGIGYEKPMSPVQVAAKRAERIAREKKAQQEQQQQRLQAAAAAKQQQQAAAIAQAVATATTATVMTTGPSNRTTLGPGSLTLTRTTNSATSGLVITTPRIVSTVRGKELKQSGPITRTTLGPGSTPIRTVNSAASSIVVNTPPGAVSAVTGHTFATINKRMSQGVATIATVAGTVNAQVTPTVASSLAQVVRAQAGTRTSVVTLPSTAGIITSQVRGVTTATVVMTTSASTVQARSTPTLTGQLTVASMKNLTQLTPAQISQLALFKQQALRQQQLQQQQQSSQLKQGKTASPFRLQQLKQADIKRLQQAQAQAQAAQVQAQAQAQAAQQQVTAQALQAVQKTGVTATVVGTTAATVVSAAQAQLTARQQQVAKLTQQRIAQSKVKRTISTLPVSGVKVSSVPMQQAVQQKQTTLTRPTTLKESDVAALIKLQQQRVAQSKLKGTITTLPVSGVKVSSVPMQVKGVVSGTQGQKAGQATAMKALTIQPGGKLSLQQILQMQQAQKVQQAAAQQKLLGVKAQLLQKQVAQVQQVVTSGGAIRVSSPVVATSSVAGHQQMVQSGTVQAGTVHQVQGLQVSQGQLAQGVRLQQVTSAQGGTSTVVQRVAQVAQSPMTTVRQQLGLQQQVKAAAAAQGTTLSIQQAIKPVTLIQTGASLLPGTKTATATSAQLLQNKMLAQIVTSAAAAQQSTPTSTVSVTQLARVVAPPATVQAVQVTQPQQTLTVESVAIAAPVQPKQEEVKEAVPSLTTTVKPAVAQPVIAAPAQQAQVSVTAQPSQPQQQQAATAQPIRTVTAAQLQQAQAALRQQQQQQQAAEAQSQQGSSQRTSPYAMRLRKPSQTNN